MYAGKSALTLGATTVATGILDVIGAKHLELTDSLVGISAGALIGALTLVNYLKQFSIFNCPFSILQVCQAKSQPNL